MPLKPLTYGNLPTREEFDTAFYLATQFHIGYKIAHGSAAKPYGERPEAGWYSAGEMWRELNRLMKHGDDTAMQWVSNILDTLGWEWI